MTLRRAASGRTAAEVGFVVAWSSGFIGAVLGTQAASAATLLAWRFFIATALLMVWVIVRRRRWPSPGEVTLQGTVGVLSQVVYLGGVVGAVQIGIAAGTTALVASLQPLVAVALAGPILGERTAARQWVGLAVGLVGVALVVGGDIRLRTDVPVWAYALPIAGMAGLVAATLLERGTDGKQTPLDLSLTVQCAVSAVVFGGLGVVQGDLAPPSDAVFWVAVVWTVVLSHFGGYGFYWLNVRLSSVSRVSSLFYLTPPTTMLWAYLMFGERIGALALLGMLVCVCGVALARENTAPDRKTP